MSQERANNAGVKFTVVLPEGDAARVHEFEQAVRAAGFEMSRGAELDELTGLLARAAGLERLHELWALSIRHGEPLSCLLISIDQMRGINEAHGVEAGDHVLREVARLLRAFARTEELVCRVSGNEFLVMCPKSTARAAAIGAERHRWAAQSSPIVLNNKEFPITISVGVAERTEAMTRIDELVAATIEACAAARSIGGNRVRVHVENDANVSAPLLEAVLKTVPGGKSNVHHEKCRRTLILHDPGVDPAPLCAAMSRLTLTPTIVSTANYSSASVEVDDHVLVMAAIGRGHSDWNAMIRSLRGASSSHRVPVLLWGDPSAESHCQCLIHEGADAFLATTDAPRVLDQIVRALLQAHAHQHQLLENQSMRAEQARMLTTLFDLARAFASADTLDRCLDRLSHIAGEMLRAGRVATLVCHRDRSGLSDARITDDTFAMPDLDSISMTTGLIGQVCRSRESMILTNLDVHQSVMTEFERDLIFDTPAAITPMVTSQRVVGVLIACARPGQCEFKPWEVAMLDLLSNIAAASIDDYNARTARDEAREAIVVALAKLTQHRDGPTAEHVNRVATMCVALAKELSRSNRTTFPQIDDAFITNLEWAVPLHDIGKVGLPDHILLKPGRLTDDEMEIMRSHVEIGRSALHSISTRVPEAEYLRMAEQIAHAHHEWFDGTGYPMGLKGEEIPLAARIASVADAYDAITSSRVYKDAVAHETAVEEIRHRAGSQFDPRIVEAFMRCRHMFGSDACADAA